jgi:hypothetical protein
MKKRTIDGHQRAAEQVELARNLNKIKVRRFQSGPVVLAEIADRAIARRQSAQQPHHLNIARRLTLQATRGANLVEITI